MSENKQKSGSPQSQAFAHVTFCLHKQHGTVKYESDVLLAVQIEGLKDDMSLMFGIKKEEQKWYYNSVLLSDDQELGHYIDAVVDHVIDVYNLQT